jgi:hypothetical protein
MVVVNGFVAIAVLQVVEAYFQERFHSSRPGIIAAREKTRMSSRYNARGVKATTAITVTIFTDRFIIPAFLPESRWAE